MSQPSPAGDPKIEDQRSRAEGVEIGDLSMGGDVDPDDFPSTISG